LIEGGNKPPDDRDDDNPNNDHIAIGIQEGMIAEAIVMTKSHTVNLTLTTLVVEGGGNNPPGRTLNYDDLNNRGRHTDRTISGDPAPPYCRAILAIKSELKVDKLPAWDGNHKTAIQYFWDVSKFADRGWMPKAMGFWLWSHLKIGSDVCTWFSMLDSKTKNKAKSHYLKYLQIIKRDYLERTFQNDANVEYGLQHF
jgi:hypothetical protein